MKLTVLRDDKMPKDPVLGAPGFKKKGLAHAHWEPSFRCGAGCLYCSTNVTIPMQFGRKRLMRLAAEQLEHVHWDEDRDVAIDAAGDVFDPTHRPDVTIVWDPDEAYRRLEAQVTRAGQHWGKGRTLQVCQLVDPLIGPPVSTGLTYRAVTLLLERTSWRLRVLTKCDLAAREPWMSLWKRFPGRVVIGLSIGNLDDAWAAKMEPGTTKPTLRARALRRLQDAGIDTFGMACPIHPNIAADKEQMQRLIEAIRPEACETVWVEPENERGSANAVREVYPAGSEWRAWYDRVYPPAVNGRTRPRDTFMWSEYATNLYRTWRAHADKHGWIDRMIYLLYEQDIAASHASEFRGFRGVSLQGKPSEVNGLSTNPYIAELQRSADHGRTLKVAGPDARGGR